nr:hypothetical protein [Angustibacter aerolatus]
MPCWPPRRATCGTSSAAAYAAVPAGEEHLHLDVDHAIERLLA